MYRERSKIMILTIILFVFLLLTAIFFLKKTYSKPGRKSNYNLPFEVFGVISIIIIIITIIAIGGSCYDNNSKVQRLKVMGNKITIYENQRNALTAQYKQLLDTNYRNYESNILTKMTEANKSNINNENKISVNVLPAYPQLKYQESLMGLVQKIDSLNKIICSQQIELQDYISSIKTFHGNIWLPSFIYKDVPKECEKYEDIELIK